MNETKSSVFENFTNKYSLSKTLRFELKPEGKTLENMKIHLGYDKDLQTFLKDQAIEDAYQALKPVFDFLHEEFITDSLTSEGAKGLDFSPYLKHYRERKSLGEKEFEQKVGKPFRALFAVLYDKTAVDWKERIGNNEKGKPILKEKGFKILTESGILEHIRRDAERFSSVRSREEIEDALKVFDGFFTYFGGFNQNRENYYETKKEAATSVATRIVHENFPKFSDNIIAFESRKSEYLDVYSFLSNAGKTLVDRENQPINDSLFKIEYFNKCLSQGQIEAYNSEIGNANFIINLFNQEKGRTEKGFKKLPLFKTLYKQIGCGKRDPLFFSLTDEQTTDAEKRRASKDNEKAFSVEEIILLAIKSGEALFARESGDGSIQSVKDFVKNIRERESYEGIYWSKAAINTISARYFSDWQDLKNRLKAAGVFQKAAKGSEDDTRIPEAVELKGLLDVLDEVPEWRESLFKAILTKLPQNADEKTKKANDIIMKSQKASEALITMVCEDIDRHMNDFLNGTKAVEVLMKEYFSADNADDSKEEKRKIWKEALKQWMDHVLAVNQMVKYFSVRKDKIKGNPMDSEISNALDLLLFDATIESPLTFGEKTILVEWFKWYDALRNFLTKKPQDDVKSNKLKLNFRNSTLAGGWDVNKETDNFCVLLFDGQKTPYLAVTRKESKDSFQREWIAGRGKAKSVTKNPLYENTPNANFWNKMEYDFWSDVSKMIPKCSTQVKAVIKHFQKSSDDFIFPVGYKVASGEAFSEECKITKESFNLNNRVFKENEISVEKMRYELSDDKGYIKMFQKEYLRLSGNDDAYRSSLVAWIDFCKYFLSVYPKTKLFQYEFRDSSAYLSIDEFYGDVDRCSYKLTTKTVINKDVLDKLVEQGDVYLFKVKNQDYNTGKNSGHKNNLHTMYWQAVFEDIENRPKLNGEAEIFYRKALSTDKLEKIQGKKGKDGKDVIKNYRFSKDKFVFHVPITLNFCMKDAKVNDAVNSEFCESPETLFLGIDRGEKHLAYYSLSDRSGRIVEQGTLNVPFKDKDGNARTIVAEKRVIDKVTGTETTEPVICQDYNDLLDARAGDRDYARKNWQTIGTIKELKNGYVSQAIHPIVHMATARPTFIALEKLNVGFMRSRQKIEKSVYQKFELALAKKLNFLVDKNVKLGDLGSVTKALQLTPPVNNFGDIEKLSQAGIMLYVRADYTSQTDPKTGWRRSIYIKGGSEENIRSQIVEKFSDIYFDGKDYVFVYDTWFDEKSKKNGDTNMRKTWKLYSGKGGESLVRFHREKIGKDKWETKQQNVPKMLDELFSDFDKQTSLIVQVKNGSSPKKLEGGKHTAWESLRFVINLIQQIRNTGTLERDEDFIYSPVRDENGEHFDSRRYLDIEEKGGKAELPVSGDANGAYNIARKGIIAAEHIKRGLSPYIFDQEWDAWLAGETVWKKWLENNQDLLKQKKGKK